MYLAKAIFSHYTLLSGGIYAFETKIAQGIQIWVQNNQLSPLSSIIFFQKPVFGITKSSNKSDVLFCFYFFDNIDAQIRPDLKNLSAGLLESVKVLPKC